MSEVSVHNSSFTFTNFYISESHFVLNANTDQEEKITVDIEPTGVVYSKSNKFLLKLRVIVYSKNIDKLRIEVVGMATFSFEKSISRDLSTYLLTNAPAIAFPYIRAYISNITAQSGIPTITLPTYNLSGLRDILKENITTEEK